MDTFPFNADRVSISGKADTAKKAVIGGIKPGEFTGDGGKTINISGQLLPTKIGGLTELQIADVMRSTGEVFPVMRGDGVRLGNYSIKSTSETHKELDRDGVGFVVTYRLALQQEPDETPHSLNLVSNLLSVFDIF
ncbi:phage tail protein [Pseudovibrio sp. Tun.PSC04-5.I4]|uniref:phage tail protein n=1 Tax=Pseudovibrio sp. Tun.PSC04-5.I4 TaxID=1798213 RepID=UPI001AD94632|nr:phage tail protein [Pseudovibrio sp. Tun.PSC04-5.I4]